MSDKSNNISLKPFLWVVILILVVVILIIVLNRIDNIKKYNQYKALYESILNSEYPDRFEKLTSDFSINDTSLITSIKQNLEFLQKDIPEVDYSEIYINGLDCYYNISNYKYFNDPKLFSEIKYLPQNIKRFIDYLNKHESPSIDSLYSIVQNDSKLELVIKTGKGYLIVNYSRN
jgi:hypothetical protein